ncbi:STAS domain-containing protein [Mycobacterium sp. 236(2023)]|uniref:STAS domain-containing protein n=1 Tax=Mycobacterium sp. 236(2023) TaxID=3038163 RepID=UPI00241579A6|nr:STAS domain-containing protein [Mycobacterium sp. 236(2023)]MDG4664211.1 STAS domain-containing protein [Mycobacterium sp. 236(2023)]
MPHVPPSDRPPDRFVCRTAYFETAWPQSATAVVKAHGELDAANGITFVNYALRHSATTNWLVVDLSGLSFFSTAGFSALHTLNVRCVGEDIRWAVVPGKAVRRVLKICDPDSALPICADISDALTAVQQEPPQSFQLIPQTS